MKLNKTQARLQELGVEFETFVDNYGGRDDNDLVTLNCGKCGGTGNIPFYNYHDGGICYECHGDPSRMSYQVTVSDLRRKDRERVNRNNRIALKRAESKIEADKKIVEFENDNPGIISRLKDMSFNNSFADSLVGHLLKNGALTDKQLESAKRLIERDDKIKAERENSIPVPEGKINVVGTIVSVKDVLNTFSYNDEYITKMVVRDDRGFTVYGTLPKSINNNDVRGKKVSFTATVTRSRDDETFGYYSRPSKATLIR